MRRSKPRPLRPPLFAAAPALALAFALAFAATLPPSAGAQGGPGKPPPVLADPAPKAAVTVTAATAGSWRLRHTLRGHEGAVYSASFVPGGARVVTSGDDGHLRVWDVRTGKLLRTLEGPGGTISDTAVSPDGRLIAYCTDGGTGEQVRLIDAYTFRARRALGSHREGVFEVVFSPDGRLLASGGRDHVIRLWDVSTGRLVRELIGHDDAVTALAFTRDGLRLASGSAERDNTVRVWNVRTGEVLHTLAGHDEWVTSVAFAPDGATLASGGRDHKLIVWDARAGRKLREQRQPEMVYEMEFSPDGRVLAEAGGGGRVRIHDARTGKLLSSIKAHTEEINEVKFAPGGLLLLTASYDATVKLWEPAPRAARDEDKKPPTKWME